MDFLILLMIFVLAIGIVVIDEKATNIKKQLDKLNL